MMIRIMMIMMIMMVKIMMMIIMMKKPSLHQGVMPVQLPKKHWVVLFPFSM